MRAWSIAIVPLAAALPLAALAAADEDVDEALAKATALLNGGKGKEARKLLEPLAAANPKSAPIQYLLGQAAIYEKDFPRARKHLEKTIELDPAHADARLLLASIYRSEKKPKDATRQLEEILKRDPASIKAMKGLAELEADAKRYEKAAGWYEKALAQKKDDADLALRAAAMWTMAAQSLTDGPKKKREDAGDKAIAIYRKLLEEHPDLEELACNIGAAHIACGRWDEAIKVLTDFLEKHPDELNGLFDMAEALEGAGRTKDAIEAWKKFVDVAGKADARKKTGARWKSEIPPAKERIKALEKELRSPKKGSKPKKSPGEEGAPKVGL